MDDLILLLVSSRLHITSLVSPIAIPVEPFSALVATKADHFDLDSPRPLLWIFQKNLPQPRLPAPEFVEFFIPVFSSVYTLQSKAGLLKWHTAKVLSFTYIHVHARPCVFCCPDQVYARGSGWQWKSMFFCFSGAHCWELGVGISFTRPPRSCSIDYRALQRPVPHWCSLWTWANGLYVDIQTLAVSVTLRMLRFVPLCFGRFSARRPRCDTWNRPL